MKPADMNRLKQRISSFSVTDNANTSRVTKGGMAEEDFNCLFCYCPLYALGEDCGGNFTYYKGVKDCTDCLIPHSRNAYDYITSRFGELVVLAQEKEPVDSPEKI